MEPIEGPLEQVLGIFGEIDHVQCRPGHHGAHYLGCSGSRCYAEVELQCLIFIRCP